MYDFIVVDAGVGGLYCANKLSHKKVLVVESAEYVGGRCFTATNKKKEHGEFTLLTLALLH